MIELSNGFKFEFVAASGAYSFDGKGWYWDKLLQKLGLLDTSKMTVVIKTLTRYERKGNLVWSHPWTCVRPVIQGIRGLVGTINAVGLTNPGIGWWCREIGPTVKDSPIPLIASIMGSPEELVEMVEMLEGFGLKAIEINASCPNTGEDLARNVDEMIRGVHAVRCVTELPIILKISIEHEESFERIVTAVGGEVEAIDFNSVPYSIVFPGRTSPLAKYKKIVEDEDGTKHLVSIGNGGVSGEIVQPHLWPLVAKISSLTDIPIIGPSVWKYKDVDQLFRLRVKAVSLGAVCLCFPRRPNQIICRWERENPLGQVHQ